MGDMQLFAELSQISKVTYYPESTATYRIHGESATRSKDQEKVARFCISACDIKLYLCEKYHLSEGIRKAVESDWCDSALRLALHSRNIELADEVRKRKKSFTGTEWLRYCAAGNVVARSVYTASASVFNLLRKKQASWQ